MSESESPAQAPARDVDIARSPLRHMIQSNLIWLCILAGALVSGLLIYERGGLHLDWSMAIIPGVVAVFYLVALGWQYIVRRGMLPWMRLAQAPAKAFQAGDPAAAQRALDRALERARRFRGHDYRRGVMLLALAGFLKNQGRYADAKELYEESVAILAHPRAHPLDYLVALNEYAVFLIDSHDHAAAQRILETVLDLTLACKVKERNKPGSFNYLGFDLLMHINLVFLCVYIRELAEAQQHMTQADALYRAMRQRDQAAFTVYYRATRAWLMLALGRYAESADELTAAGDAGYALCLRVRWKMHLIGQKYADAEALMRRFLQSERTCGLLHRPDLRDDMLDLGDSLFGQGKHDEAFATLAEAQAIVADFALPADAVWRHAVRSWQQRARELGRAETAALLDAEAHRLAALPEAGIMISARLRIRPAPE